MFDEDMINELLKYGGVGVTYEPATFLPTGSFYLDFALSGGYPRGMITSISGRKGYGKTSIALMSAIHTKESGGRVAYVDFERKFDVKYAYDSGLGKPGKDYLLLYPPYAEAGLEQIRVLARSGNIDLCVIDAIGAIATKDEVEGTFENDTYSPEAKVLSKFLRGSKNAIADGKMAVLALSQLRANVGTMSMKKTKRPGGFAIEHHQAVGIDLSYPDKLKSGKNITGIQIEGKVWANCVGPNFREFSFNLHHLPRMAIDQIGELIQVSREVGVFLTKDGKQLKSSGHKHFYKGKDIGTNSSPGYEVYKKLLEDDTLRMEIAEQVRHLIEQGVNVT